MAHALVFATHLICAAVSDVGNIARELLIWDALGGGSNLSLKGELEHIDWLKRLRVRGIGVVCTQIGSERGTSAGCSGAAGICNGLGTGILRRIVWAVV